MEPKEGKGYYRMSDKDRKLPIGIENFGEIRSEGFYYIDKTGLIRELLQNWGKVNLFTRPRRFGKSLNMSMLKHFFEIGCEKSLFEGLEISRETGLCQAYMGQFPVISISLKEVSGRDYRTARAMMCGIIGKEALRFSFLLENGPLNENERRMYEQLITVDREGGGVFAMSDEVLMGSLQTLSLLLSKYFGRKVILLIDEYDVPLAKAFDGGYYEEMAGLLRNLFGYVLKTNEYLHFAVLTGCLRIAKESIFTGLNNLRVLSVLDVEFDEYFGFTNEEVQKLLAYYGLLEHYETIKEWYDGYRFGNVEVYCPWDVICYSSRLRANPKAQPEEYWSNTSSNDVIRRFLELAKGTTKREIEELMAGNTVEKVVHREMTYHELYDTAEHLWSLLFTTGYLTVKGEREGKKLPLVIPNREIRNIFQDQILDWFQDSAREDGVAMNPEPDTAIFWWKLTMGRAEPGL